MPRVTIDADLCESSGCCEMVCPEDVFEAAEGRVRVTNAGKCTSCWICVDNCATSAVNID